MPNPSPASQSPYQRLLVALATLNARRVCVYSSPLDVDRIERWQWNEGELQSEFVISVLHLTGDVKLYRASSSSAFDWVTQRAAQLAGERFPSKAAK